MPIPFAPPQGGHLIGQPFTISDLSIPVNAMLSCNCACEHGGAPVQIPIIASAPGQCSHCSKVYAITFNPQNGQLQVRVLAPEAEKVPS